MLFRSALCKARENGCIVTSEMEVFFEICPARIIAVTGSDGKTTTTNIIERILARACLLYTSRALKGLTLEITGKRPIQEAVVTSGGVSTKEIDPSTMESKKVSGLYFAGEVIDVDAYTGGYNLQIAFSTGYLAADQIEA